MRLGMIRLLGCSALTLLLLIGTGCGNGGRDAREEAFSIRATGEENGALRLSLDLGGLEKPEGREAFPPIFHLPPVRQDETGTCWAFAATSLLESELKRLGRMEVKLSEMHTAYWEYVEKARRFVRREGDSFLGQGSEPNSALARIKQYGLVRASDYSGLPPGKTSHDHSPLFKEFKDYLQAVSARRDWDESRALSGVRDILDRHLGRPPERIAVDGRDLTPLEYLGELGLEPDDYVSLISFLHLPFYARGVFRVPDNWWRSEDYHNLPLDEFYEALRGALGGGYTAVLAVDFSEPGYSGEEDVAVIPSFDIPRNLIDQSSREFRFANGTSTDDHSVHCVGLTRSKDEDWFLIKDSWENAYRGAHKGYFFYRGDYVRLKCLMFLTHGDAVRNILAKFPAS
ncbi:MAG: peptidase C1 [Candidatus Aminicenantes bacterium]|nr:peptidase C1 [Candidatus Aminicenantes bacterium]